LNLFYTYAGMYKYGYIHIQVTGMPVMHKQMDVPV